MGRIGFEVKPGDKFGIFTIIREVSVDERRCKNAREMIVKCIDGAEHHRTFAALCYESPSLRKYCSECRRTKRAKKELKQGNA